MTRNSDFTSYCDDLLNDAGGSGLIGHFDHLTRETPMEPLVYYDLQPVSESVKEWVFWKRERNLSRAKEEWTEQIFKNDSNTCENNVFFTSRSSCSRSLCNVQSSSRISTSTADLNMDATGDDHLQNKRKGSVQ